MKNPVSQSLNLFIHNNEIWMRIIPGKALFHSTMVHSVVNRGDVFAVRLRDGVFSIVSGNEQVEQIKGQLTVSA